MESGDAIGDWVVVRTLGRGGMGTVFLCHHRSDPEDLAALKIFPAWSTDADGFKRFEREIDVLTRLRHPGIVPLKRHRTAQGRDSTSGVYWIAMEFVDGPSLESRLDQGPLPAGYAASQFRILADALSYAHAQGVFHRDIKPANIVLGRDGVRLVDFGIALQRERTRLTAVGTFAGTLAYMPPEVVVDERVHPNPMMGDIYALGVVLYEAVTARRAFATERGLSDRARQMRILKAKMKADALDPGPEVHEALRRAVVETTNPDPATRLSHWGRFIEMMEAVPEEPDDVTGAFAALDEDGRTEQGDSSGGHRRPVARPARGRLVRPKRGVAPGSPPRPSPLPSLPEPEAAEEAWADRAPEDSDFTQIAGRAGEPTEAAGTLARIAPAPEPTARVERVGPPVPPAPPAPPEAPPREMSTYARPVLEEDEDDEATAPDGRIAALPGLVDEDDASEETVSPEAVAVAPPRPTFAPPPAPPRPAVAPPPAASAAAAWPPPKPPAPVSAPSPSPTVTPVVTAPARPAPRPEVAVVSPVVRQGTPAPPPALPVAPRPAEQEGGGVAWAVVAALGALLLVGVAVVGLLVAWPALQGPAGMSAAPTGEVVQVAPSTLDLSEVEQEAFTWVDTGLKQPPLPWPGAEVAAAGGGGGPRRTTTEKKKGIQKRVRFTAVQAASKVFVNGRQRGETPLTLVLDAGTYELRFVGAERTLTETVDIGTFSADEYQFNEARREIKPRFN